MSRVELDGTPYPYTYDIPTTISMDGWKNVRIEESNQSLVSLDDLDGAHPIRLMPMYHMQGVSKALDNMNLRKEATERLISAAKLLPEGYSLIIFDSYRPIDVQTEIFNSFKDQLRAKHPEKTEEDLIRMAETYVSSPSIDPNKPSPHATGGAIDLSIVQADGKLLDMGTEWDSFDIESQTAYFKNGNNLYHNNRRLLYEIMTKVGFTNYPEEWWHYDFGNQFWGHIAKTHAIYGIVEGGDTYAGKK